MKSWQQTLLKILYGSGIAALAWFSADAAASMVRASVYDVPPVVWEPKPLREEAKRPAMSNRIHQRRLGEVERALAERNPFCPQCVDPENPEQPAAPELPGLLVAGEQPTELPLQLLATMESTSPQHSLATIRWTDSGRVGVLGPGDACAPHARVHTIGHGMVHLDVGGQLEYLELLEHESRAEQRKKKRRKRNKRKRKRRKRSWEIDGAKDAIDCENHRCSVDRAFVDKLLANPAKLTRQAKVRPRKNNPGFKLYRIRRGSVPHLLGIRSGDVLMSVNGRELDSIDDAMGTYQKLRNASRLELTLDRRGKTVTKVLDIG